MYRILVAAIVLFALAKLGSRFRAGQLSRSRLFSWTALWLGVLVLGMWPRLSDHVSRWVNIERGATLLFFLSILLLFYITLNLHLRLDSLQRQLTELVRVLALRDGLQAGTAARPSQGPTAGTTPPPPLPSSQQPTPPS